MFGCSDSGYVLVVWIYLLCLKFAGGVGLDLIVGFGVGIYGWVCFVCWVWVDLFGLRFVLRLVWFVCEFGV